MIKKLKAKHKKETLLIKIAYLKKEWAEGRSTQADADLLLLLTQEAELTVLPYYKDMAEPIRECKRLLELMDFAFGVEQLSSSQSPFVVFAGFTTDLSDMNVHLNEHKGEDDQAVVLGHFSLPNPDKESIIQSAMELSITKGVVFLISQKERDALLEEEWDRLEEGYINRLKPVLDTKLYTFFAEKSDMGIELSDIAKGDVPNLSDKLFVARTETELEQGFHLNEENRIMTLQHGMVTKLEMREHEAKEEVAHG